MNSTGEYRSCLRFRSRPPTSIAALPRNPMLVLVFLLFAGGCSDPPPGDSESDRVARDVRRLQEVAVRALDWVATLDLDPIRVREELGMKGVKHLVEHLDLLYHVYRWSKESETGRRAHRRALEALRVTDEAAYHNLLEVDDKRFRQDSMSYLRACHLAEQFGRDTTRYREEIARVLPRIYGHLSQRGVDQRMGFALLFSQLGLEVPERLEEIYPESLIAKQVPLSYYHVSPDRPYDITHEIFAMTARGRKPFPFPGRADESYAKNMVRQLLQDSIRKNNLDLAAEFVVNMAYLGESESILTSQARAFLFKGQNPDGSFAKYDIERARAAKRNPLYDARIGGNLHTTMVCIWALVETTPSP